MTNTITFHLKRDLVFLCSLQNTYHNWLNLGPNRDQRTEQLTKWRSLDSWLWKLTKFWSRTLGPSDPDSDRNCSADTWLWSGPRVQDSPVLVRYETGRFWFVDSYLQSRAISITYQYSHFSSKIQPGSVLDEQFLEFFLVDVSILLSHLQQTFMAFGTVIAPYQFTKNHSKVIF